MSRISRRSSRQADGSRSRIYFFMHQMLLSGTKDGLRMTVGRHRHEVKIEDLNTLKPFDADDSFGRGASTLTYNTGGGTDHDEEISRNRSPWTFEEIYDQRATSLAPGQRLKYIVQRSSEKVQEWIGWRPYQRIRKPPGIYFDLRESKESYRPARSVQRSKIIV